MRSHFLAGICLPDFLIGAPCSAQGDTNDPGRMILEQTCLLPGTGFNDRYPRSIASFGFGCPFFWGNVSTL
uniref:Putative secreted protein n=1 Tax=Anopheles marajoara TaxID=58244 RepID=A0A2M4CEK7_9DIPT